MTDNKRVFLNIIAIYGWPLYALVIGLFCGHWILKLKELGLNQSDLAKRMKCSRAYVSKVCSGDVSFAVYTAARFAKALKMDFTQTLTIVKNSKGKTL